MNYNVWLDTANKNIDKYPSTEFFNVLLEKLYIYIPSYLPDNVSEKVEKRIRSVYKEKDSNGKDLYDYQLEAVAIIKQLNNTKLTGKNSYVLPHFVTEYALMVNALKELVNKFSVLKPFNQIQDIVENITKSFEIKDLGNKLKTDLEFFSNYYLVDIDISELMKNFKGGLC